MIPPIIVFGKKNINGVQENRFLFYSMYTGKYPLILKNNNNFPNVNTDFIIDFLKAINFIDLEPIKVYFWFLTFHMFSFIKKEQKCDALTC